MHSLSASILAAVMILCGKGEGRREGERGRKGGKEGGKRVYICTCTCIIIIIIIIKYILHFLETGTLTLSQYILLDPPLMFFVMASTYCAVKFQSYKEE